MPSSQASNDTLSHEDNIKINEAHNLIVKLYANLLTSSTFQNGIKQLNRISQPIIGKFDDNLVKLTSNVSKWVSHDNIFNQLVNIWLVQNLPITQSTVPFEKFTSKFDSLFRGPQRIDRLSILENFYSFGMESWRSLDKPSIETIKHAVLKFVAKTINKTYNFADEALADALYERLSDLIEVRRELVSGEAFLNLVKTSLGQAFCLNYSNSIRTATNEYYVFAKKFILIDFPLATNNKDALRLIFNFIQDSTLHYRNSTLDFVEKKLNSLLNASGHLIEEDAGDATTNKKTQRVLGKIYTLSSVPLKKLEAAVHQIQQTETYTKIDSYLHINDATLTGYTIFKQNLIEPGVIAINKAASKANMIVDKLSAENINAKYNLYHAKYEVLKKCVVITTNGAVKFIFDARALAEASEEVKKQFSKLIREVANLQVGRVRNTTVEYYHNILKRTQNVYDTACEAVSKRKLEQGDEVTAKAILPPIRENLIPVGATTSHVQSKVIVTIHNLFNNTIKRRYVELHAKYEVLQKCAIIVKDETVSFIFDVKAWAEASEEVKKQISKLSREVAHLQVGRVKNTTVEYYHTILKRAQTTYSTARTAVYDQKVRENDQIAANAIRPSDVSTIQALKDSYTELHANYEVLKKCVFIAADGAVRFFFDAAAWAEASEETKKQASKLFHEVTHLQVGRVMDTTVECCDVILQKAQTTYNTARKAVYDQKLRENNEVAANAIRPAPEQRSEVESRNDSNTQKGSTRDDSNAEVNSDEAITN